MTALTSHHLHSSLSHARTTQEAGRWHVRRLLSEMRDLLTADAPSYDGWLAAREAGMLRERNALLARVATLTPRVLHDTPLDDLRSELQRLLVDVEHHLQRRRDLAWDEVSQELGGSE